MCQFAHLTPAGDKCFACYSSLPMEIVSHNVEPVSYERVGEVGEFMSIAAIWRDQPPFSSSLS